MQSVERRIEVTRPRREVFEFATSPDNFPAFVATYSGGHVRSPHPVGAGAEFDWTGSLGPLRLRATERVTAWRAPEHVAYQGAMVGVPFRSSMDFEETCAGSTALTVRIAYEVPARLGGRVAGSAIRGLVDLKVKRSLECLAERFGQSAGRSGEADPALGRDEIMNTYHKRAKHYDRATKLYGLVGFPLGRYRRMAVDALGLRPGDTAVEIGCGTGANFDLLQDRVGPTGRIIGVDLTEAMLREASRHITARGWTNVELVQSDAASFEFPLGVRGILSMLALTLCPDYDAVVARGALSLAPGGRWVVFDLKEPQDWPLWAVNAGLLLGRPYGVRLGAGARHPWESIERHLPRTRMRELSLGAAYLAVGEKAQA